MTKQEQHKDGLRKSPDWILYLKEHSCLPGKRADLELMEVMAELGDESFFLKCLEYDDSKAPTNTPGEFVATCGARGLGKLINEGKGKYYDHLKELASDTRWRVREGVAFALQAIGKKDFEGLMSHISHWKTENLYVKRALVAGLCEPILLKERSQADTVLSLLDDIINSIINVPERKDEPFRVLKKGLGYGLSVAMVADPEKGKELFEKLKSHTDKDILWILKENLKKNRLIKMDKEWTERMKSQLL